MQSNKYYCTRPKLYSYLLSKGFAPRSVMPNYYNPKYCVWVFEYTDKLIEEVNNFFETLNK